jgi:alkylation response protein AidB-like acyl-CoA dehydrogenase
LDFSRTERVETILQMVSEFMRKEVYPLEPELRHRSFAEMLPRLGEVREKVKQLGLFAPHIPEELGGAGLQLTEFAHLSEQLGRSPLGHYLFNCQAPDISNMELLLAHGSEEQKRRWLMPLIRGEIRSCFLMTEPEHAGSNPVWLSTTAREQDGQWVIRGHKWFATAVEGAAFGIVMAVTDPDNDNPYGRASMILVPTDAEGFELIQNISVMGHRGSDYASHAEVMLHGVRVPRDNLLGPRAGGFLLAQERLGPGRIHHCMRWVGVCERAFELMCDHAARRELAPGRPLGTRQIVQQWIADSRAEIHGSRLMVLHAAWKMEQRGAHAAREEISLIKFWVANVMQRVLDRAIQTHGGLGMTDDTPLAYWYAHERAARIYDGADEVHKTVVARRILRDHGIQITATGKE